MSQLLDEGGVPWAIADLGRELGIEPHALDDVLADLARWGLIHREGGLVFASRAAVQFDRLFNAK